MKFRFGKWDSILRSSGSETKSPSKQGERDNSNGGHGEHKT